jgi:hypothetical protein
MFLTAAVFSYQLLGYLQQWGDSEVIPETAHDALPVGGVISHTLKGVVKGVSSPTTLYGNAATRRVE